MYGHYGINHNIENIFRLAAPHLQGEEIVTMKDLKPAYLRFLQSVHPEFPIADAKQLIVQDSERAKALSLAFSASRLNDLYQERMVGDFYSPDLLKANALLVKQSLETLRTLQPDLADLFDLAVHSILLCGSEKNQEGASAHGGTTNKCIGLIWLNLKPNMSEQNIIEMLIHELTHTLVFLDELNFEHFNYDNISKKEYWAVSSILKRQRPMDKVIHSILVSMEILFARKNYLPFKNEENLVHPNSVSLMKSVQASISSVLEHPQLPEVCLPRTVELIKNAQTQLQSPSKEVYATLL